ncbi:hypothetical protein F0L74_10765 [Chitinophaga agrisoli]|uniref:ABC transporter permease n=1 Tax=Chitinophaga agrisoli TaxID=2607653 RepID=A0A5B2VW69_9BACT|nr:ABC transporter permease [Chitinophaga agrisoli]KAA2242994.1 hypothetical protein F0L74_10765 [Chitinophaga agrisoli]
MPVPFLLSFQSEWLKQRHSAASWIIAGGSLLIPVLFLGVRLYHAADLPAIHTAPRFWEQLYNQTWQIMGAMLMPLGVIVVTSLVTQLEFRNNTWKQLYTTPQGLTTIFFAKMAVILVMVLQCFVIFNIGFYITGVMPALLVKGVPYPAEPLPFLRMLMGNGKFFIACLPIVALQYLLSLQCRNVLLPIGIGIALHITSMLALRWEYGYILPYIYGSLSFLEQGLKHNYPMNIQLLALGHFVLLVAVSFVLFIRKKDKG